MRRSLGATLALAFAGVVLLGCTPGDDGTIGIQREADGSLTALIRLCHDSADALILTTVNSFPSGDDGTPRSEEWESVPDLTQLIADPVVSDDVPIAFDESELRSDVLYVVRATGPQAWASSGMFGAVELAAVEPGQVLTSAGIGVDGVFDLQSREEFEAAALDFY